MKIIPSLQLQLPTACLCTLTSNKYLRHTSKVCSIYCLPPFYYLFHNPSYLQYFQTLQHYKHIGFKGFNTIATKVSANTKQQKVKSKIFEILLNSISRHKCSCMCIYRYK